MLNYLLAKCYGERYGLVLKFVVCEEQPFQFAETPDVGRNRVKEVVPQRQRSHIRATEQFLREDGGFTEFEDAVKIHLNKVERG